MADLTIAPKPATVKVTAAASSKVLISGAYLIIDPKNEGIVLSTDAKFYTTVKSLGAQLTQSTIKVLSPQFKLDLSYTIVKSPGKAPKLALSGNGFLDKCIAYLALVKMSEGENVSICPQSRSCSMATTRFTPREDALVVFSLIDWGSSPDSLCQKTRLKRLVWAPRLRFVCHFWRLR